MLTLGVLGIRLALGAQTEREGVKPQPTHPQPHPGTRCQLFPRISLFIPIFSRLLHHHIPTQALPKLPAGRPDPHPGLLCSRMSCNPIHPHLEILDKTSPGSISTPFRTQAAAAPLLWMLFPPRVFPCRGWGGAPEPRRQCWGGPAPAVTYLGWVPGRGVWGPGRAARPGGARSGFGVPSC